MPRPTLALDAPRPIVWPRLGDIGTVTRQRIDAHHCTWLATTPAGRSGRALSTQSDAVLWLRMQADPNLMPTYVPAPDPVLEMIQRRLRERDRVSADAAVLACIAQEIANMRRARQLKSPPALWHHLDQFTTWLEALNGEPVRASRVVELVAATRR
jgi:hypothetical protein